MPAYDYWCKKCDITKEENHGMMESPEIHCPKCDGIMQKTVSGGGGFIMKKDGTRNSVQKYKKTSITPTPTESAKAKANGIMTEKIHNENMAKDPYYKFRNT